MKRLFVVLTLLVFSCALCFAGEGTESSTTLDVTAMKSGSLSSDFALVVTASVPQSIVQQGQSVIGEVGSVESFDLTDTLRNNNNASSLAGALALTVSTNSKRPVLIDVWFSAFRDTTRYKGEELYFDGVPDSFINAKWTAKSIDPAYTAADEKYEHETYEYMLRLTANNKQLSTKNDKCEVTATNASGQTMNLVFTPTAKNVSMPESDAPTLPGMDTDKDPLTLISRTTTFDLAITGKTFTTIPANTNYTCTVRITVKGD